MIPLSAMKLAAIPCAAILGFVALLGVVHEHDAKVKAEVAAQQAVVAAQAQHEQDARTIAGLDWAKQQAFALAATMTKVKETIHDAPKTSTCANTPAIRALVGWMRSSDGGDARPEGTPAGVGVGLPSPAAAPARR